MSELELTVRRAALLLVELQNDIVHESNIGAPGFRGVAQVQRRGVLAKVQIEGTWGAETHAAVTPTAQDFVFTRSIGIDGSYGTQLYPVMRMLGRDALLVCGVSTNLAVEGLVRASVNRGFEMLVIEDCCASFPDAWHDFSVTNIPPLLSAVTSAAAVRAAFEAAAA